jgi:hypothetical protein
VPKVIIHTYNMVAFMVFQSTLLGVPAYALYNPDRESRTILASKLLQSPFLAQDCVHFVWCMPSEMANGLRVTSTL